MFLFHCSECSREIRVPEEGRLPAECPDCGQVGFVFAHLARQASSADPESDLLDEIAEPVGAD